MKTKSAFASRLFKAAWRGVSMFALGLGFTASALADTTTLMFAPASKDVSNVPVMLTFPVTRSGDLGYDAVFTYHTLDGSAFAGTDYTGVSASITIPAGSTTATIPVTIAADTGGTVDQTFQLVVDTATGIGPAPNFAAQQTFATGMNPYSITAADFNGDGKPDMVVVNRSDNTISVMLNTGAPGATTPSFAAQQVFATRANPLYVTAADINGDGKPDLIVGYGDLYYISVLLNVTAPGDTTPSFAARQDFVTGTTPNSITVADVNGDGKPDLIVANLFENSVSVLLNTSTPGATTLSFAVQQTFAAGSFPYSLTSADVNGDGKPDLIVANGGDATVSVLLNTTTPGAATPSFAAQQTFATGSGPQCVTVADVNGDGELDLIVANLFANTVSVLLNTTAPGASVPSFALQQTFATGSLPFSVIAADINGDGKPDLIVANESDSTISVLRNTTAPGANMPSFATQQTYGTGSAIHSVTAADINGDGVPDLMVANGDDATVSVLLNTTASPSATLNFATQQTFATGLNPETIASADFNGDGRRDVAVVSNGSASVAVLLNTTAPGTSAPSFAAKQEFATGSAPASVAIADFNGDGLPDLVVANLGDNTLSVLLNTTSPGAATPSFAIQQTFAAGVFPYAVATADVNGDGRPDLVVANIGANTVSVLLNTMAPGAAVPSFANQQTFATGGSPDSVAIADLNGDGRPDLVVANNTSNTVSVLLNTTAPGATIPTFAIQQSFAIGNGSESVTTADINGDGRADIIAANHESNTVSVLLNITAPGATAASFAAQQTFATGTAPIWVIAADVDGDGKTDLIVANSDILFGATVSVLINTTAPGATMPSFAAQRTFATGASPVSVAAVDIDGNGKPDLVVVNYADNNLSVLLNAQYQTLIAGSPATGTIVHEVIFANGFE